MKLWAVLGGSALLLGAACQPSRPDPDAVTLVDSGSYSDSNDAGLVDGGVSDAGATDGGAADAGVPDAGNVDAGSLTVGDDVGVGRFRVLFDNTRAEQSGNADWVIDDSGQIPAPANPQAEADWTGGYSAWGVALSKSGNFDLQTLVAPNTLTFGSAGNPQDLKHFHAFVLPEPNIALKPAEMTALLEYVKAGGGLFYLGDHGNSDRNGDGVDSVGVWNQLVSVKGNPFGITFAGDNFYQAPVHNLADDPASPILHGPFGDVAKTTFFNGSTLKLDPVANPTARPVFWKNSAVGGNTNVLLAVARLGRGRVAVFGDSSAADDGTGRSGAALQNAWGDSQGNNAALFPNVTFWLADQRCTNGVLDPGEADVDCGGRCGGCAAGMRCVGNADCSSNTCAATVCTGFTIERVDAPCSYPSLALDAEGRPQVAYGRDVVVGFASRASGSWVLGSVAVPPTTTYSYLKPRMTLDATASAHVLWTEGGANAFHATASGASWTKESVGAYEEIAAIAFDPQKRLNALLKSSTCKVEHAVRAGTPWTVTPLDPTASSCGNESLALDPASRPNVAYGVTAGSVTTPRLAILDTGLWTIEQPTVPGIPAGVALDASGNPHLVLYGTGVDHAWKSAGVWTVETVAPSGNHAVIALDANGAPVIVFDDYDSATTLSTVYLARKVAGAWDVRAVGVGTEPSLALDPAGQPVIAFCGEVSPYPLLVAR